MTGHRMIGVAKEGLAIFGGYPRCPQATRERVAKVVNANQWQAGFVPCPLPAVVVHLVDAPATIREHPDGMLPSLRLDDRPGDVIENHHVRSLRLEGLCRNDEDAPPAPAP
jgi:hypothetical protein